MRALSKCICINFLLFVKEWLNQWINVTKNKKKQLNKWKKKKEKDFFFSNIYLNLVNQVKNLYSAEAAQKKWKIKN